MRVIVASAIGVALCLATSAAFAQAQPQQTSPSVTQPATMTTTSPGGSDAGNQVICRSEPGHGSLIPTRTCHTQREWDAMRLQGQRSTSDSQLRGLTSQPMGK